MTEYPYILFNKSPEQLRHLGVSLVPGAPEIAVWK
jgi:hypothetical protein